MRVCACVGGARARARVLLCMYARVRVCACVCVCAWGSPMRLVPIATGMCAVRRSRSRRRMRFAPRAPAHLRTDKKCVNCETCELRHTHTNTHTHTHAHTHAHAHNTQQPTAPPSSPLRAAAATLTQDEIRSTRRVRTKGPSVTAFSSCQVVFFVPCSELPLLGSASHARRDRRRQTTSLYRSNPPRTAFFIKFFLISLRQSSPPPGASHVASSPPMVLGGGLITINQLKQSNSQTQTQLTWCTLLLRRGLRTLSGRYQQSRLATKQLELLS